MTPEFGANSTVFSHTNVPLGRFGSPPAHTRGADTAIDMHAQVVVKTLTSLQCGHGILHWSIEASWYERTHLAAEQVGACRALHIRQNRVQADRTFEFGHDLSFASKQRDENLKLQHAMGRKKERRASTH